MNHIGKTLDGLLGAEPLATGMLGWRAVELWNDVVGESVSGRARAIRFVDGRLIVEVVSSAWMQELAALRGDILRRLNDKLRDGSPSRSRNGPVKSIQLVLEGRSPHPRQDDG